MPRSTSQSLLDFNTRHARHENIKYLRRNYPNCASRKSAKNNERISKRYIKSIKSGNDSFSAVMSRGFSHILWVFCTTIWWLFNLFFRKKRSDSVKCLVGKTAIVTGGNSGIGYAVSTLLAARGCKVIIADSANAEKSKNKITETTRNENVTWKHLDLASFHSIRSFAKEINADEDKIDILINNAGIGACKTRITDDNLNKVMQVNYFGSFLLTHLLIDSLKAAGSSRVIFTSSVQAFFSILTSENLEKELNPTEFDVEDVNNMWNLYCNSKLCNMFAAQEFGKKLREYNISVNSADPGAVVTELLLSGDQFDRWYMNTVRKFKLLRGILCIVGEDSFEGAQTAFDLAANDKWKHSTGHNCFRCRQFMKHKILEDRDFCDNLWKRTENLVKLSEEEKL